MDVRGMTMPKHVEGSHTTSTDRLIAENSTGMPHDVRELVAYGCIVKPVYASVYKKLLKAGVPPTALDRVYILRPYKKLRGKLLYVMVYAPGRYLADGTVYIAHARRYEGACRLFSSDAIAGAIILLHSTHPGDGVVILGP